MLLGFAVPQFLGFYFSCPTEYLVLDLGFGLAFSKGETGADRKNLTVGLLVASFPSYPIISLVKSIDFTPFAAFDQLNRLK